MSIFDEQSLGDDLGTRLFLSGRSTTLSRGPQLLGHGPSTSHGLLGTVLHSRKWVAEQAKEASLLFTVTPQH